jgi:hypothetical protein
MRVHTVLAVAAFSLIAATGCHRHSKKDFPPAPPPAYPGSYAQSCRAITTLDAGYISAECADEKGKFVTTFLQATACHGDIGNNNGIMVCNGAVATSTKPVIPPPAASDTAQSGDAVSDAPVTEAPAKAATVKAAPDGLKP